MDTGLIVDVIMNATSAMASVFLISAVGLLGGLYPKNNPFLTPSILKDLARLCTNIFLPALVLVSLGKGLTIKDLFEMSIIIVFCGINIMVSYAIAYLIGPFIVPKESPLFTAVVIACSFPNSTSLPILILQTSCKQIRINEEYDSNEETCNAAALSMLFIYSILWQLLFWIMVPTELESVSRNLTQAHNQRESSNSALDIDDTSSSGYNNNSNADETVFASDGPNRNRYWVQFCATCQFLGDIFSSPPMVGIGIGILIGVCAPVQSLLFSSKTTALSPLGVAIEAVGQPVVTLSTLIMAASLAQTVKEMRMPSALKELLLCLQLQNQEGIIPGIENNAEEALEIVPRRVRHTSFEEVSQDTSVELTQPTKSRTTSMDDSAHNHCSNIQAIRRISDASIDLGVGISVDENMESELELELESVLHDAEQLPSYSFILMHCACRLILTPICIFPILGMFKYMNFVGESQKLLQLIVVIESCVPSAQLILIVLNQLGLYNVASKLAYLYVFQYLISIFTLTFWFSIGMLYIYD